ncbi:hypothetical protein A7X67_11010 [Clostridium sp. W14A]|nr:hypothetical protein A7X67_11010 [Clostridium sp. W14A]
MSVSRKTGEIYYTDDELQTALQNNNALQYALSRGYHLIKDGNEFRLKEHDSMVFLRNGEWFWNSQHLHGKALDFIQGYENKGYKEAVCILAGTINRPAPIGPIRYTTPLPPEEKQEFILPEHSGNFRNLFAYLVKERGFDSGFVKDMVEQHKIFQGITYNKLRIVGYAKDGTVRYAVKEKFKDEFSKLPRMKETVNNGTEGSPFHTQESLSPGTVQELLKTGQIRMFQNLVMVGYDKDGIPRYASMRSMNSSGKPVKVDVTGSDKSYPFVLEGSASSDTVCVFESPIEAMSYWTLCKITGSERISCPMISLGGAAAIQSLDRYLREHPEIHSIVIGLNNDSKAFGHDINAGRNGTEKIMERYGSAYTVTTHKPFLNDWNDVLKNFRKNLEGEITHLSRPAVDRKANRNFKSLGVAL